jgi:formylglycine-generating enzyme required for sulfatase activity
VEFCRKLSARTGKTVQLPTEAQWEYACRAGTTTAFHTGDSLKPGQANAGIPSNPGVWDRIMAWLGMSSGQKTTRTTPAGSFPPNDFGLYDMHGNVNEWCSDWYDEDYYANSPKTDPQGPDSGMIRVLRGGGWLGTPQSCRSAIRSGYTPGDRDGLFGFRVAVDLPAGQAGLK